MHLPTLHVGTNFPLKKICCHLNAWYAKNYSVAALRIGIQLFISMRIRIQGAKVVRVHADPGQSQKV
jgi:hypothetical protein